MWLSTGVLSKNFSGGHCCQMFIRFNYISFGDPRFLPELHVREQKLLYNWYPSDFNCPDDASETSDSTVIDVDSECKCRSTFWPWAFVTSHWPPHGVESVIVWVKPTWPNIISNVPTNGYNNALGSEMTRKGLKLVGNANSAKQCTNRWTLPVYPWIKRITSWTVGPCPLTEAEK